MRLDGLADGRLPHGDADDADVVDLYLRLVRRLRKLHEDEPLVIVGHEYGRRNIMAGHFRRAFPEAWPWRTDRPYGGVQRGGEPITYFWVVGPGVEAGELRRLLREIVRDEALTVVLAPSSFTWLFYPFGQAGDLAVVDRWRFDLVLAEFEAWVCHHDDVPDDGFPPGA
ncbi:hypothetical protein INN71_02295 [Nocardioides sp. ChNu-153]|uniref:hypothetical protein n=1 Tax=unclassified Nocardioides TaxID=2615069 RepID=UPI002407462B|nr:MULTISPECIES: hypothetical protein [unclassified Nocardioides]MDF9716829.1 hypothetical protein [Nocardioides sp. ChNu-99]MDN7120215.1 hypothetical protein [Nocardioides sp. ChNu-153]